MVEPQKQRASGEWETHREQTSPRELTTTVNLREVLLADGRLEASAYNIEARNAISDTSKKSGLELTTLYGPEGLCKEAHNAFRFKRIFIGEEKGIHFLSSSDIISCKTRTYCLFKLETDQPS